MRDSYYDVEQFDDEVNEFEDFEDEYEDDEEDFEGDFGDDWDSFEDSEGLGFDREGDPLFGRFKKRTSRCKDWRQDRQIRQEPRGRR